MKKETIKAIDALFGTLICWFLTVHRRIFGDPTPGPVRKILFLKLIEQGATVLAAPALDRAIAKVGKDNVYFCVFRENRPILDFLDRVPNTNVIEIRQDTFLTFLRETFRALRHIRREEIDVVVDMEFMARAPAILAYLTGASRRVGLYRYTAEGPYRGDLMTHRVQYTPYLHTSQAYRLLVDALDQDPSEHPMVKTPPPALEIAPQFKPPAEDVARVRAILNEAAGRDVTGPIVLLNPNTGDLLPLRMWPVARFVELGRRLYGTATIVLTGAPSERAGAEAVAAQIGPDVVVLAGRTTLRDVIVLYTIADVLVTNDSGPGHFASMTPIHNVVLFGPETPQLFGPLGPNTHVVWEGLACSPCVSPYNHRFSPCSNNRCMQAITVDRVYAVVQEALGR